MMDTTLELNNDSFILGIPFVKVDTENRIVEGFATLDNIDKAGDILDFDASKEAFASWPGNIREMHEKKAVGRAVNFTEKDYHTEDGETYHGIWLKARISKGAEDTWQKVLDGTLSGFSVGGAIKEKLREMKKSNGSEVPVWRVVKYSLGEVSLVDNPCNGLANTHVGLVKFADGTLELQDVLEDLELEKATNMGAGAMRPPMKPTAQMQSKQDPNMQMAPAPEDSDIPLIQAVIKALTAWRDSDATEGDDHDVAFISSLIQQLKERVFNGDPGEQGNNAAIFGNKDKAAEPSKPIKKDADDAGGATDNASDSEPDADDQESVHAIVKYPAQHAVFAAQHMKALRSHAEKHGHKSVAHEATYMMNNMQDLAKSASTHKDMGEPVNKSEEIMTDLQNKEIDAISNVEGLTEEHKGVLRKFLEFLTKDKATSEEQVEKGETEMDETLVKEAIGEAVETLSKSAEDKFTQIGESLTNVASALEKLATTEALDEIKKSLEATVAELATKVTALEESGAVQKSNDDSGEKLEKSEDKGFWSNMLVPEYVQARVAAGR